ncbi:hypothetical protein KC363_g243 [Hortaea werneckii]|nr:hypothetical protein KC363_g243 [Hortaea werneckii]
MKAMRSPFWGFPEVRPSRCTDPGRSQRLFPPNRSLAHSSVHMARHSTHGSVSRSERCRRRQRETAALVHRVTCDSRH